ncbi:CsiV family protein [Marinobacterium sp. MBR-109]|jgi:hypothetical protein|uniref:CsiV family protein n=1 Tax=Marinobacterium sp. MBR-109 TaxID=3156462 RepID=UPI0033988740
MPGLLQRTLTLATLSSLTAIASAADLYKVEMLVFANESGIGVNDEYWPDIAPADISGAVFPRSWDGYPLQAFEELPRNDLRLSADASRLTRSGDYSVLYHRGWLQPIGGRQQARSVRVKASTEGYELDGSISIYRNRFLHAQPSLQLSSHGRSPQALPATDSDTLYRPAAWLLQDARRMRSNEIHYIDHPQMGVLLIIRPVDN